jgi:hypothetical protein
MRDEAANKLDLELSDQVATEIRETVELLKHNKVQLGQRLKYKFKELQDLRGQLTTKPDDLELASATALVEKEYETFKARVAEVKAQEQLEREVA